MIAVVDIEGRRLYNSFSYQKVLGYTREEILGKPVEIRDAGQNQMVDGASWRNGCKVRIEGIWCERHSCATALRNCLISGPVERGWIIAGTATSLLAA